VIFSPMTFFSCAIAVLLFQNPAVPTAVVPATAAPSDSEVLGPGDQILIRAIDIEELDNKPVFINRRGKIDLPVVGQVQAAGLTPDQLEDTIRERLTRVLRNRPDVSVSVTEVHSQGVSVLGAVTTPGVHQLQGEKTLFEVLSLAGGLRLRRRIYGHYHPANRVGADSAPERRSRFHWPSSRLRPSASRALWPPATLPRISTSSPMTSSAFPGRT
jgi:protein involved in polysaccharide export with SLBB domain